MPAATNVPAFSGSLESFEEPVSIAPERLGRIHLAAEPEGRFHRNSAKPRAPSDSCAEPIYPPETELDFREYLIDTFLPQLKALGIPFRLFDLTGFLFEALGDETLRHLQEDEFDDYRWMKQGLSTTVEATLRKRITRLSEESPGCAVIVYATVALHPLVRYGEVLRELR
jgi:hypothetical protein